jgi:hypothetical protein
MISSKIFYNENYFTSKQMDYKDNVVGGPGLSFDKKIMLYQLALSF